MLKVSRFQLLKGHNNGGMMVSSRLLPPLPNDLAKTNWVEAEGGLPDYFVRVAKHIFYGGKGKYTLSEAIAGAESQTRKRAAKGNKEAIKAMTQWEEMKAKAHGGSSSTKKLSHSGTVSGNSMSSSDNSGKQKLLKAVKLYKSQKGKMKPTERARVKSAIIGAIARQKAAIKQDQGETSSVSQIRRNTKAK